MSGNGISWAICKSAPRSRQITTPATHHSVFYRPDALPAAQPTVSKHWRQLQTEYTEAILSNSTRTPLWFEISKMPIAVLTSLENKLVVSFCYNFPQSFVPYWSVCVCKWQPACVLVGCRSSVYQQTAGCYYGQLHCDGSQSAAN